MKLVTAVITPYRWAEVRAALEMVGISGITVTEVLGSGRRHRVKDGPSEIHRGDSALSALVRLEVVVEDAEADQVVSCVVRHARTGSGGSGKVWVRPVDSVVRVRAHDEDRAAL